MKILVPQLANKRCVVCDGDLNYLAAWIPYKGEVCMICYRDYLKIKENNLDRPHARLGKKVVSSKPRSRSN